MSGRGLEFCLDVGAGKVCGLLAVGDAGGARVVYHAVEERPGPPAGAAAVGRLVAEVRRRLEAASGLRLERAHVAVPGGALRAARGKAAAEADPAQPLGRDAVAALEGEAVTAARGALQGAGAAEPACVGFSVLAAGLDGRPCPDLVGRRGSLARVEVLATFLPAGGLEPLLEALRGAGLEPASLVLDSVAGAQLLVPGDLRRANLGFVDMGAGATGVAVVRGGRVDAGAAVPLAGDAATECLADAFVLDFRAAEALKRGLPGATDPVEDLFGARRAVGPAEASAALAPFLARWAGACADALREANGGAAPRAVLLAGGGSLLDGCSAALARALGLEPGRVGRRAQDRFAGLPEGLGHPRFVAALAVAAAALDGRGLPFGRFTVNGAPVRVLNLRRRFTALDALLAQGGGPGRFHAAPGRPALYSFNGLARRAPGGGPRPCALRVGGAPAGLDAELADGDRLEFTDAAPGEDAHVSCGLALEREGDTPRAYAFNGAPRPLPVALTLDGAPVADLSAVLEEGARLEAKSGASLRELLAREGVDPEGLIERRIVVTVEGEPRVLVQRNHSLRLNGREAALDAVASAGDRVDFEPGSGFQERVRDLWNAEPPRRTAPPRGAVGALGVTLNGAWAPLDRVARVWMNGREVGWDEYLIDGADLTVERAGPCAALGEALHRLGLRPWLESGRLRVSLNGAPAGPDAVLRDGDRVDLALDPGRAGR